MNLDNLFKFKIGDVLTPAVHTLMGTPERMVLVVVRRLADECCGGVQLYYDCRVHTRKTWGGSTPEVFGKALADGTLRLGEFELIPLDMEDYRKAQETT